MENFYLIVGLGNPGAEYGRTRHNAGFLVVERLAQRWQAGWALDEGFRSRLARAERQGRKLMLCQPQTYMNSSGEAVVRLQGYYRVPLTHLVVAVDDDRLGSEVQPRRVILGRCLHPYEDKGKGDGCRSQPHISHPRPRPISRPGKPNSSSPANARSGPM